MQGRSLEYLDGADRLSQGAFYFPSLGQNKGIYAESSRGKGEGPGGGKARAQVEGD